MLGYSNLKLRRRRHYYFRATSACQSYFCSVMGLHDSFSNTLSCSIKHIKVISLKYYMQCIFLCFHQFTISVSDFVQLVTRKRRTCLTLVLRKLPKGGGVVANPWDFFPDYFFGQPKVTKRLYVIYTNLITHLFTKINPYLGVPYG